MSGINYTFNCHLVHQLVTSTTQLPRSTHSSSWLSLSPPLVSTSLKSGNCSLINAASALCNHLPKDLCQVDHPVLLPGTVSLLHLLSVLQHLSESVSRTFQVILPWFHFCTYQWWPSSTISNVAPSCLFSLTSPHFGLALKQTKHQPGSCRFDLICSACE